MAGISTVKRPQLKPVSKADEDYVATAKRFLIQWAREMNRGGGVPNILAMVGHIANGERSILPVSPGPMFSPVAERADMALRAVRLMDPKLCQMLIASALGYSLQDIAEVNGVSKSQTQRDMGPSYAAFAMALFWQVNLNGFSKDASRPRKMIDGDLYFRGT